MLKEGSKIRQGIKLGVLSFLVILLIVCLCLPT